MDRKSHLDCSSDDPGRSGNPLEDGALLSSHGPVIFFGQDVYMSPYFYGFFSLIASPLERPKTEFSSNSTDYRTIVPEYFVCPAWCNNCRCLKQGKLFNIFWGGDSNLREAPNESRKTERKWAQDIHLYPVHSWKALWQWPEAWKNKQRLSDVRNSYPVFHHYSKALHSIISERRVFLFVLKWFSPIPCKCQ